MKLIIFVCAVALSLQAKAQYYFNDTRRKTESFERFRNWEVRKDIATFTLAGIGESVGAAPLPKLEPTEINDSAMVFEAEGIKAVIKITPFDSAAHRLSYDGEVLVRIDRRPYYGNYGKKPVTSISGIVMIIEGDTIPVPATAYQDLHNMKFTYMNKGTERTANGVYRSKDGKKVYLYALSKGDRESYEVTWIFVDGKYFRRVLDYGML